MTHRPMCYVNKIPIQSLTFVGMNKVETVQIVLIHVAEHSEIVC